MVYQPILRTKGVIFFSITLIAFGTFSAFLLILSLSLMPLKDFIAEVSRVAPHEVLSLPIFWLSTWLSTFVSISWIISGIGCLHLKEWARKFLCVTMSLHVINMFVNITLNIIMAEEILFKVPLTFLIVGIMISFAYYLSVIYFFSHPAIVKQFKYKTREY